MDNIVGYAAALVARDAANVKTFATWIKEANSEEEAFDIGVKVAREIFPVEEGFYSWGAAVRPVYQSELGGQ